MRIVIGFAFVLAASVLAPAQAAQVCQIDVRSDRSARSSLEMLRATLAQMQAKACKEGDVLSWSGPPGSGGDAMATSASLCDYSKTITASDSGFSCVLDEPRNFR